MIGSGAKRRPNPPPRYIVLTFTLPGTTPATWARMPCAGPWDCVPAQISTSPSRTQAVQLSGSMHECERYGASYSASIFFAGVAALASPSLRPTAPPAAAPAESIFEMPSEESVAAQLRRPVAIGEHRHAARDLHHLAHAANGLRLRVVDRGGLAARHGRVSDHRGEHAGEVDVQAELGFARRFGGAVQAPRPALAEQRELARVLELDVLRRRELRRFFSELAVGKLLAALVHYRALLGPAFGGVGFPGFRSRGDQHRARCRARLAHRLPVPAHRGRSAGRLHAEDRIGERLIDPGLLDPDPRPVSIQLLGDQHRDRGVHALAHLREAAHHGDVVVRRDTQIGAYPRLFAGCLSEPRRARQSEADDQTSAGHRRGFEKLAARGIHWSGAHDHAPFALAAASLIAARIWL